jgi:hypothetical protein
MAVQAEGDVSGEVGAAMEKADSVERAYGLRAVFDAVGAGVRA